jgi:A/G-specific adenine glycosylase
VVRSDTGALLLETRPEKGLLGGMLGWPTSDWGNEPSPAPPLDVTWTKVNAQALHTFTHFHLQLDVMVAMVEGLPVVSGRHWVEKHAFQPSALAHCNAQGLGYRPRGITPYLSLKLFLIYCS